MEEGLAVVAEGLGFVTKTGERFAEAELHRVKGELLLARTPADPAGAEASFRDALEVARRQSAKSYELRAARSLARLWQQQGRKEEARELLAPVYDWFTEGFDTRDLKEGEGVAGGIGLSGRKPRNVNLVDTQYMGMASGPRKLTDDAQWLQSLKHSLD